MGAKLKNVTFSLPVELIHKLKGYAQEEYIPSVNAGVREAIEEYVTKLEKEKLYREMLKAADDPLFVRDLAENMQAFEASDREPLGREEEW
ncbi:hypothetical protein CEB3_c46240 [Peptococcaceae bacterium CEB3]|nr:hypothetical protein CEB3_c46240 [Peptococcaceae bacterium CEB3]